MAEYAKRTCFQCGVRLPQPKMQAVEVSKIAESGLALSTRDKWMCPGCWESYCSIHFLSDRILDGKLLNEAQKTKDGKLRWIEEQEKRRLANIAQK